MSLNDYCIITNVAEAAEWLGSRTYNKLIDHRYPSENIRTINIANNQQLPMTLELFIGGLICLKPDTIHINYEINDIHSYITISYRNITILSAGYKKYNQTLSPSWDANEIFNILVQKAINIQQCFNNNRSYNLLGKIMNNTIISAWQILEFTHNIEPLFNENQDTFCNVTIKGKLNNNETMLKILDMTITPSSLLVESNYILYGKIDNILSEIISSSKEIKLKLIYKLKSYTYEQFYSAGNPGYQIAYNDFQKRI